MRKKSYILLPFVLFLLLGGTLLLIALKTSSFQSHFLIFQPKKQELILNLHNFKTLVQNKIQDKSLPINAYTFFETTLQNHYHYKAIIKKFDSKELNNLYYIDIYGFFTLHHQTYSYNQAFFFMLP